MGFFAFLNHIFNFVLPAVFLGSFVAMVAPILLRDQSWHAATLWGQIQVNCLLGMLVLVFGLIIFGQDGKIWTYLALVCVVAISQWWQSIGLKK